jgi:hypothetical protein
MSHAVSVEWSSLLSRCIPLRPTGYTLVTSRASHSQMISTVAR